MGATAVLVGFRHKIERKHVLGQTDDCLVADVRAGDDTAFEAIYDRYARGVLAFCVHMLGSYEAAEDALQLTFVSAYRALRNGDRDISLRPWLYTIARNRCLSELRSRRDADIDLLAVDRSLPDGLTDQVQRREELREMVEDMQRLPADQRAALVLFELGDHSHTEIAAVLGVRREKVKALIFQAREGLLRGRHARNRPCAEIRERLATVDDKVAPRSTARAHIDRCPSCAAFEDEVHHQRAALALILPVIPAGELKASVLGAALSSGGAAAVGAGVGGGGAIVAGSTSAAGGATAAGGASGAGALAMGGGATGTLAGGGATAAGAAVAASAPVSAIATGLTAVGADYAVGGIGGLGASSVVAKILTAAAIATGAVGAGNASLPGPRPASAPSAVIVQMPSVGASPSASAPPPVSGGASSLPTANAPTPIGASNSNSTATEIGTLPVTTPSAAGSATSTQTTTPSGSVAPATTPATTTTPLLDTSGLSSALPANEISTTVITTSSGPSGDGSTAAGAPSAGNASGPGGVSGSGGGSGSAPTSGASTGGTPGPTAPAPTAPAPTAPAPTAAAAATPAVTTDATAAPAAAVDTSATPVPAPAVATDAAATLAPADSAPATTADAAVIPAAASQSSSGPAAPTDGAAAPMGGAGVPTDGTAPNPSHAS